MIRKLAVAAALLAAPCAGADEIVTLKTRADATQSFLLLADAKPQAVAVMLPGGQGLVGLPAAISELKLGTRGNFLVRTRDLFRDSELAVAIVDSPSDHSSGMDESFRLGREHAADLAAVVRDLKSRFPGAKIILVGTSRGTLSAAYAGRSLGTSVDGVVLTSSVLQGTRRGMSPSLSGFDFAAIKAPLLFVHHAADACKSCPYSEAQRLGRSYPLITVNGGKPAESGECEPLSAHGYFGKEEETVSAVKNWILGRPFSRTIE